MPFAPISGSDTCCGLFGGMFFCDIFFHLGRTPPPYADPPPVVGSATGESPPSDRDPAARLHNVTHPPGWSQKRQHPPATGGCEFWNYLAGAAGT